MKTMTKHSLLVSLALILSIAAGTGSVAAAGLPARAADGPNLLVNPGFEAPFNKQCCRTDLPPDRPATVIDEIQVAQGWSGWWLEPDAAHPATGTPAWHRPEYRSANCHFPICAPRVHSGDDAQHYFTFFSLHDAGLYQQVSGITPGSVVQFSIYLQAWSTNANIGPSQLTQNMNLRIGIDPTGGTNAFSSNVIWGDSGNSFDAWTLFTLQATAQGSQVTVFTRSTPYWGVQHNDVYADDASLVVVGASNTSGGGNVSAPPSNSPAPNAGPGGTYTVQPGDILTRIAYRLGVTVDGIVAANHLKNSDLLSVSQVLLIPGGGAGSPGDSGASSPPAATPGPLTGPISYVVVAGDSLYKLQYEFGVDIQRIKALNQLKSDTIYIGQTLTIAP